MEGANNNWEKQSKKRARPSEPGKMPVCTPPPQRSRRQSTGDQPLTEATLRAVVDAMEKRVSDQIDSINSDVAKNKNDIKEVRDTLASTETNLLVWMDEQKRQLETLIWASPGPGASRLSTKQEENYWLHRRSLSVWPIIGDDVTAGLKTFLMQKLRFTEDNIREIEKIMVKRMKEPIARGRKEAFCTFETKEGRDVVKAASKHLTGEGPGVGLRAQFPGFLLDNFRLLETVGYNLRANDPSIRRSIKFNDSAFDLFMDWKRIYPEEARLSLQANPRLKRGPEEMSHTDISNLLSKASSPATGANSVPRG